MNTSWFSALRSKIAPAGLLLGWLAAGCLVSPALAAPGAWSQGADMPMPTSTPASCALDGLLYVMGGHTNRFWTNATDAVWAYNPKTDLWASRASLPTGRHYLGQCAVPLNGLIYLVGGSGPGNPGVPIREVAVYNPQTDTWTNAAPMPTGRGNFAACAVDGIIYAIAGALDSSHSTDVVEAYDPASNQWTTKSPMPQPRKFVTASVANGIIYVFIGTDAFAYNPQTDAWTTKPSHFSPYSWGLMSAEVGGIIYLFGGGTEGGTDVNINTWAYDPARDQFTARRKALTKRANGACGVIEGKVYLAAGLTGAHPEPGTSLSVFDPQGGVMPWIISGNFTSLNSFHLVWQGEAGIAYGVESRTAADSGSWTRMMLPSGATVTATNGIVETTCTVSRDAKRFFRVYELTN